MKTLLALAILVGVLGFIGFFTWTVIKILVEKAGQLTNQFIKNTISNEKSEIETFVSQNTSINKSKQISNYFSKIKLKTINKIFDLKSLYEKNTNTFEKIKDQGLITFNLNSTNESLYYEFKHSLESAILNEISDPQLDVILDAFLKELNEINDDLTTALNKENKVVVEHTLNSIERIKSFQKNIENELK